MIALEHLSIEEFRGIRALELDFNGESFVIHGQNGSGKSGVVDAIDFALTGNIRRLSGQGTGGLSVAAHGPHVQQRNNPRVATVKLRVRDHDTGETATISRSVYRPTTFTLEPEVASIRASLMLASAHPELTLSRREIVKFILTQPTSRAEDIQALLKLDRLSEYRKLLRTVQSKTSAVKNRTQTERESAERALSTHLGVAGLLIPEMERVINPHRVQLGAQAISGMTIESDLLESVSVEQSGGNIDVDSALRDVETLRTRIRALPALETLREALVSELQVLSETPGLESAVKHRSLYAAGLALVDDEHCPLCGVGWASSGDLRAHIEAQIERSALGDRLRSAVVGATEPYRAGIVSLRREIEPLIGLSNAVGDQSIRHSLESWRDSLTGTLELVRDLESVLANVDSIASSRVCAPVTIDAGLEVVVAELRRMPDQSERMKSYSFLTSADERRQKVQIARVEEAQADAAHGVAVTIYETYCTTMDSALTTLYEDVESEFSRFYQLINSDDEASFSAHLTPSAGALALEVDFHSQGMFPPGAYHSEGHQDGMGICLYLALVKHLLGPDFRFAILDDVVMSVDTSHRKQFCRLLRSEFPDVQFIITTHDTVWARQMRTAGLVGPRGDVRLYGWTVQHGPMLEQGDIWNRIESDLQLGDVNGAAHKLRRGLEMAVADIAESIGGRVAFRGDGNYDLADFLSGIKGKHLELLKRAAAASQSWGDIAASEDVAQKKAHRAEAIPELDGEQWAINPLVHNNDWAQFSVEDFRPVVDGARRFLELFLCSNDACGGWIYARGHTPDALRCDCGAYNLNLRKRSA